MQLKAPKKVNVKDTPNETHQNKTKTIGQRRTRQGF